MDAITAGLALILSAPGTALDWMRATFPDLDPAVQASLVTFTGAFALWWLTGIARLLTHRREHRRRMLNTARSLQMEITKGLDSASGFANDASWQRVMERLSSPEPFTPFFTVERTFTSLFDKFSHEVLLLPKQVVEPVFEYYKLNAYANDVLTDFCSKRFAKLENARKKALMEHLQDKVVKNLLRTGADAKAVLAAYVRRRRYWPL